MKFREFFFHIFFFMSVLYSNWDDNIFSGMSSPRNIALGGIHLSGNNLNLMFDAPVNIFDIDEKYYNKNFYFCLSSQAQNISNTIYFGSSIYIEKDSNLYFGLVRRLINDNYNTEDSWSDNGNNIPDNGEIDYNDIYLYRDSEIGVLLSYNKKINNNIFNFNIKPVFHKIDYYDAFGISFDFNYIRFLDNNQIGFGIKDLLSIKKWSNNNSEKYRSTFYINYTFFGDNILYSFEYDSSLKFKYGIEYIIEELVFLRFGSNDSRLSVGIGVKMEFFDIDYSYVNNTFNFGDFNQLGISVKIKDFK